jgi:superfamily II DNA or RNA helicase
MRPVLYESLEKLINSRLASYRADPELLAEHFGIEQAVLAGGYGYRQLLELVQNGADAVLEGFESGNASESSGRIQVTLRGSYLYVANTGAPLSANGLKSLLSSHTSTKRGNQIGRFGLGFKSLLRLQGGIDIFTAQSGSIRFDPEKCRTELRQIFQVEDVPRLRLAWPLPQTERDNDPVCATLSWAETIIRVDIAANGLRDQILEEIQTFPAEFLLFFPIATVLVLDDGSAASRTISLTIDGDSHILHDGDGQTRWRVISRDVAIDDPRAIEDATHIHARESVPISWAMPLEGREEAGRFWAFFPTQTQTYLPGILNAPWKLNSDRNAIIRGEWNSAIMRKAAELIAEYLPNLADSEDPGRPLDAFPRQASTHSEASPLIDALWEKLTNIAIVADGTGVLRHARDLARHPSDTASLIRAWHEVASAEQLQYLVHACCYERQRVSRLNALADRLKAVGASSSDPTLGRLDIATWFGMVASIDAVKAESILRIAKSFSMEVRSRDWSIARPTLAIIPTRSGNLVTESNVVLAPTHVSIPGRESVLDALVASVEGNQLLREVFELSEPDDQLWSSILADALIKADRGYASFINEQGWRTFWERLRLAPLRVASAFVADPSKQEAIRVRRRDGTWARVAEALLPGKLVHSSDLANGGILVDDVCHNGDASLLDLLGVTDEPQGSEEIWKLFDKPELAEWRAYYKRRWFDEAYQGGSIPQDSYLQPLDGEMPLGVIFLKALQGDARGRLTVHLVDELERLSEDTVVIGHATRTGAYPTLRVTHPLPYMLLKHGIICLSDGANVPLRALIARANQSAIRRLSIRPQLEEAAALLQGHLRNDSVSMDDFRDLWWAVIATLGTQAGQASDSLSDLWITAAQDGVVPQALPLPDGHLPLSQVFVTTSADLAGRASKSGKHVVVLDSQTMDLWIQSGAQDLSSQIRPAWEATIAPLERLVEVVPDLRSVLRKDALKTARCQQVMQLSIRISANVAPVPCLMWDGTLYSDPSQLALLSRVELLELLLNEIASSGWLEYAPSEALKRLHNIDVDARRAHVAQGSTLAERLLRAVGGRIAPLREALGQPLGESALLRECTPVQLAELVLAHNGTAALTALRTVMQSEGLMPPERWGTSTAREFVAKLGFPSEFASSVETRREPEELISGPIDLPPLHDFQTEVFDELDQLLSSSAKRRRAVVSLPTGGGKTRVTVEAAVRLVLAREGTPRAVLWIAQTDELCEQAVQAFRQVWINVGAKRTNLRIVRMWGGSPIPVSQELDKPVVVIASIQTLSNRIRDGRFDWMKKPGMVVLDECHHAITKSYTDLLRWLEAETPRRNIAEKDEPAIIGLSATPFRADDEESARLSRRFDRRWLPSNQEHLYERLRLSGVLAHAQYEALESGFGLTQDELEELGRLSESWEGLEFENLLESINQRLAGNTARNERLVGFLNESTEAAVLFFANSVEHAEEMSVRLNLAGIPAAAVSGATPAASRRYFLDRFQRGTLRVLCNHSVLTTGFDAPRTDMVLIARQVFSPVRYMQMVGRGLRGEKNGGTATCRIVTVLDNLGRFEQRHPYHYCKGLYRSTT